MASTSLNVARKVFRQASRRRLQLPFGFVTILPGKDNISEPNGEPGAPYLLFAPYFIVVIRSSAAIRFPTLRLLHS
jgi:hypothetical protein